MLLHLYNFILRMEISFLILIIVILVELLVKFGNCDDTSNMSIYSPYPLSFLSFEDNVADIVFTSDIHYTFVAAG